MNAKYVWFSFLIENFLGSYRAENYEETARKICVKNYNECRWQYECKTHFLKRDLSSKGRNTLERLVRENFYRRGSFIYVFLFGILSHFNVIMYFTVA